MSAESQPVNSPVLKVTKDKPGFCAQCGSKILESYVACPNCGAIIQKEAAVLQTKLCPGCGKSLPLSYAACPHCGKSFVQPVPVFIAAPPGEHAMTRKTGIGNAGGVLGMIAAIFVLVFSLYYFLMLFRVVSTHMFRTVFPFYPNSIWLFVSGILGILGFSFGLVGAIFIIKRRHFAFSLFCISFCFSFACVQVNPVSVILGLLAIVLTVVARHEFPRRLVLIQAA